mmetsp:Transcript_40704/g.91509  ORF Transcript_40704/g.91509 Transcript_40704/m.91509 type:complete len:222 (-) Transcript_40704:535-1200(-)
MAHISLGGRGGHVPMTKALTAARRAPGRRRRPKPLSSGDLRTPPAAAEWGRGWGSPAARSPTVGLKVLRHTEAAAPPAHSPRRAPCSLRRQPPPRRLSPERALRPVAHRRPGVVRPAVAGKETRTHSRVDPRPRAGPGARGLGGTPTGRASGPAADPHPDAAPGASAARVAAQAVAPAVHGAACSGPTRPQPTRVLSRRRRGSPPRRTSRAARGRSSRPRP